MEELQKKIFGKVVTEDPSKLPFFSSFNTKSPPSSTSSSSSSALSADHSHVLLTRPPRGAVSAWTCSKLCAICFVAGVIVGYTLKRRVRRWASKLLRTLKDD